MSGTYLLRLDAAAELLGLNPGAARRWLKQNKVPVIDYGPGRGLGPRWPRDSGKASKFDIQAVLGHQRSDTTDIYLRGLAPDLKEAVGALDDDPEEICAPDLCPLMKKHRASGWEKAIQAPPS